MSNGVINYEELIDKAKDWSITFSLIDAVNCGIRDNKFYINYDSTIITFDVVAPNDCVVWRRTLSKKQINIYKAFEKFKKEHPDGSVVFWDISSKSGIQFPINMCHTSNN